MNLCDTGLGQGQMDAIEYAGHTLDRNEFDNLAPDLLEVTGISQHRMATASGLNDYDYQPLSTLTYNESIRVDQVDCVNKVPIPPEVMEHFKNIQCHCMMGLFPEIDRAWLTIDSDIYIWTYENARDVAYFDGLDHLILSVGLIKPKPNVFIADVKYLLVITTPIEIVVLGLVFADASSNKSMLTAPNGAHTRPAGGFTEMQLMDKPIFVINTDNVAITTIMGTDDHRIFLGARDGSLYEICYQAESNWFGKRCKKINHSQGLMSYIVPGFLKVFTDTDAIVKISVDNSRKLLYVLTEKGAIEAWDVGADHTCTRRIARISANDIVLQASNVLKTVDASIFKSVVSLCPLSSDESAHLHLIAVTQGGVRLYFSTTPLQLNPNAVPHQPNVVVHPAHVDATKPTDLYLLHVRLPPGYTSNVSAVKPKSVHSAFYKHGTLLMVSTPQPDHDLLWSLSSEPFPLRPYLAESSTVLPINGQVWGVAEMRRSSSRTADTAAAAEPSSLDTFDGSKEKRKIVLLTNQGAHIVALLKPVDMLQQLLIACHGPHHDSVKAYFQSQSEKQACATSVLLACMPAFKGTELAMWATQAFILYGGEPYYGSTGPHYMNQSQAARSVNYTFADPHHRPQMAVSTPFAGTRPASVVHQSQPLSPISANPYAPNQTTQNPFAPKQLPQAATVDHSGISFSSKHAGLYLHVTRLLRPLWKKRCLTGQLHSTITAMDCTGILADMYAVRDFIDSLAMNNSSGFCKSFRDNETTNHRSHSFVERTNTEQALIEEKKSVAALLSFLKHACEVLALWKIMCEHQFHLLVSQLPAEEQHILLQCSFRDLIMSRTDTCAQLIVSLINNYLKDNASVGSISEKLREVCPNLYRHEDAVSNKATEILMTSQKTVDTEEQKEKLHTALQLCKDAAPCLPLSQICQQFMSANFYHGIVDLCATCAEKFDPNGAALHYYNSKEPVDDQDGYVAFSTRMKCYKEITNLMDHVFLSETGDNGPKTTTVKIFEIVTLALQTTDKLLHIAVYDWLLSHKLLSELLNITEPSLGEFLKHSYARNPENLQLADILWKFHERNGQHPAATHILDQLASMPSNAITLAQRIEYLARAVMCMRCDSVSYSTHNGILLKNLEDKLEIARVQQILLEALECRDVPGCREAAQLLNYTLYNITQLYTEFAEPFELWQCKLTILNCSHHNDPLLIESVWSHILKLQLEQPGSPFEKSVRLMSKVQTMAKEFLTSGHCFPVPFLAHELELHCCHLRIQPSPVPETLFAIGLDLDPILDVYGRMISMNERVWATAGNEWHLVQSTTRLVSLIVSQPNLIGQRNRRRLVSKAQDLISACRNLLYPKPDTKSLIDSLGEVELKLQRI